MQTSDLSDLAVWRIYHLMRGGVDETQPLRLAALAGVSAFDLGRINLANLFIYAHRKWGGLHWDSPDEPVFENPPRLPPQPLAKCGERLVCDNCGRITAVVPCATCPHDTPPKWLVKRHRRPIPQETGWVYGSEDNPSVRYHVHDPAFASLCTYHGYHRDDT